MMFGDGATGPPRSDPDHPRRARCGGTSSTPPTSILPASPRRSSVRRWPTAGERHRLGQQGRIFQWARTPTSAGTLAAGSSAGSRTLARLKTDWIDLYQIHRPDPNTDIDGTLGVLSDLVHQGNIAHPPLDLPASRSSKRNGRPSGEGESVFVSSSRPIRSCPRIEHDVLPTCQRYGMGVIPYSPLAGGWLSGRYRKDTDIQGRPPHASDCRPLRHVAAGQPAQARRRRTARAARCRGRITLVEMAIAFVLGHPAITAAIIGPRTMEHLDRNSPPPTWHSATTCSTASMRSTHPA